MKLLLVGDIDQKDKLVAFFAAHQVTCNVSDSYSMASELTYLYEYDCIIVGITAAEDKAFTWLSSFVEENRREGIVMISAVDTLPIRLKAFDHGIDDFLSIHFYPEELLARVKAVVRRKKFDTNSKLYFGNIMVDLLSFKVWVWNSPLKLTKKEYDILLHLIANKNKVVSKTALAEYLWKEEMDNMASYNFLIVHIKNLRKKLLSAKAGVDIENSYGIGYQLIEI